MDWRVRSIFKFFISRVCNKFRTRPFGLVHHNSTTIIHNLINHSINQPIGLQSSLFPTELGHALSRSVSYRLLLVSPCPALWRPRTYATTSTAMIPSETASTAILPSGDVCCSNARRNERHKFLSHNHPDRQYLCKKAVQTMAIVSKGALCTVIADTHVIPLFGWSFRVFENCCA